MPETPAIEVSPPISAERHVVLVAPEVHWNTGNIGRTCLGAGAVLHLVKPLGFSISAKQVRRAGLDYWARVPLKVWDHFDRFLEAMAPGSHEVALFTKNGPTPFWRIPDPDRLFLIFGAETRGLPQSVLDRFPDAHYHIPITSAIRSLNLSTAVGISLYESLRKRHLSHVW